MPPPGSLVGVVLRDSRELYGHVLDVRTMSGRWVITLLGAGKSMTVDPTDVLAVEVVDLSPERVREIAERQRAAFDPNVARGKRVGGTANHQKQRKTTIVGRNRKKEQGR